MKQIRFTDLQGNQSAYTLYAPDQMMNWRVDAFLEFLESGFEAAESMGYLPKHTDRARCESFRGLVCNPALTLNSPVVFVQNGLELLPDQEIDLTQKINHVLLHRKESIDAPDPCGVNVAQRNLNAFHSFQSYIIDAIDQLFDFETFQLRMQSGAPVQSFQALAQQIADQLDPDQQIRFLYRIAAVIHHAPFENYSKIKSGVPFRSGLGMLQNILNGFGGVCVEKTAALRFICDIAGLKSRPVLGSVETVPVDIEERVEQYIASNGELELPVWIQHHIIEVEVQDEWYLIDATNGNIPFMFLTRADAEPIIRNGSRGRMVYRTERLKYRRASNRTGDALLTLSEYHAPEMHEQYIFDQELGLMIADNLFIGVFYDYGEARSAQMQTYFSRKAETLNYPYPRFIHGENLHSIPDGNLQAVLKCALDRLRSAGHDRGYSGDFTFVFQPLPHTFWRMPRVSASIKRAINEWVSI